MAGFITIDRVTAGYTLGAPVLHDIDLEAATGEIHAIVGESGSGKSTIGKLLTGQLHPASGSVRVDGRPWTAISRRDPARHHVQMIFQDSRDALNPWASAFQTVAEAVKVVDGLGRRAAANRAEELLGHMGLEGAVIHRRPGRLSGGQCQRVGIARALAHRPKILVADEPTSALDVSVQAQVLALLAKLQTEEGMGIVLITHDLNVVRTMADRVSVLYRGRCLEIGPSAELMASPRHPYTRLLIDSRPSAAGVLPTVSQSVGPHPCVFADRCPLRQPDCTTVDYGATHSPGATPDHAAACVHPLPEGLSLLPSAGLSGQAVATHSAPLDLNVASRRSAQREGTS